MTDIFEENQTPFGTDSFADNPELRYPLAFSFVLSLIFCIATPSDIPHRYTNPLHPLALVYFCPGELTCLARLPISFYLSR